MSSRKAQIGSVAFKQRKLIDTGSKRKRNLIVGLDEDNESCGNDITTQLSDLQPIIDSITTEQNNIRSFFRQHLHVPSRKSSNDPPIRGDILFYGDSITYGMPHNYTGRYEIPWPRLLENHFRQQGKKEKANNLIFIL